MLALRLHISSAPLWCLLHLKKQCVIVFFSKQQEKKKRAPKCKCIYVTFLLVFNSTCSGMAFYISYIKNNVRNASRSYNGYFYLSKANIIFKDKRSGYGKEPHVLFNLTFMQLRSCIQEKHSSVPAFSS